MKTISLHNGTLLAVEVPGGASNPYINGYEDHICYTINSQYPECYRLPEGNWRILGRLSEITDDLLFDFNLPPVKELLSLLADNGVCTENTPEDSFNERVYDEDEYINPLLLIKE